MEKQIKDHFARVDPVLFGVLAKLDGDTDKLTPTKTDDYFSDLVEAIVCQQLSDKAGATIFGRVKGLFPKKRITATYLLKIADETLRNVGPSRSKILYMKELAKAVSNKTIDLARLSMMADEEVITNLTKLKGIGRWTAEMFLMFTLGREDIFSYGDLGLRKAIMKLYGYKKEPTEPQMEKLATRWRPYRTYAARILWKSLEL